MHGGRSLDLAATAVGALTSSGIRVTDLRVQEPSLYSVFLHITGTALRD